MDCAPRYNRTRPSRSESSTAVYAGSPPSSPHDYRLDFKAHWSNMPPTQQRHLDSPTKHQILMGHGLEENRKNYNLGMYSTKQSLSVDNMNSQPKKENLWQSMFRSATNLLSEHLTRGTGSFIKNWSSMNNPLSVTVVSPDFYKSLQRGKDHQLVNPSDGFYATRTWDKESHSNDGTLPNVLYDNEIMSDSVKRSNSDSNDSDKRWREYKNMYVDFNGTQEKDLIKDKEIVNSVNKSDCKDEALESHFNEAVEDKKDVDSSTNFGKTLSVDEPVILEKPEPTVQTQQEQQQQPQLQAQPQPEPETQPQTPPQESPAAVTTLFTNAYKKVVNGMADLLQLRSISPEIESTSLFSKRACSPKPRPKKLHNISSGRGRGRAKSQLRRSGVSQTRHRKERSRYDHSEDIKSDIDNWEELEYCNSTTEDEKCEDEKFEDLDVCDFAPKRSAGFTLADIKPKKRKQKKSKCNGGWAQLSVAFGVPSLDDDGEIETNCKDKVAFRPRLLSESSIDSEDSYCIVFENDGCSGESDYETEEESEMETETESEDEEVTADTDVEVRPTKVRFNLVPTVHRMIKWKFAYKAARPGPWEQMARDRDRFHGRINLVGRILEPVLTKQHRMRVWHERFED